MQLFKISDYVFVGEEREPMSSVFIEFWMAFVAISTTSIFFSNFQYFSALFSIQFNVPLLQVSCICLS